MRSQDVVKRINKIVSAFLNLLKVASYVSLCACSGNPVKDKCIQAAGDLLPEVKEPENVQNKEVSDKSNEAEKNLGTLTNLLAACQSCKKGNNKDKCAKDDKETCSSTKNAKTKSHKKSKGSNGNSSPRSRQQHKSSISEDSVDVLKTTPILGDLSMVFDVTGKLKINNCPYRVKNEGEFEIFLEYLEKAKKDKKSIKGLDSIFPKEENELKENNNSVRLWKKKWFWKSINAHWNLFKELRSQKFYIKPCTDAKNKEKVYIEGLGVTDFLFSDIVNKKPLDGKRKNTKTETVAEIKDEYNNVFYIKVDTPRLK